MSSKNNKGTETGNVDDSGPIRIKKYPNRRLYNTKTSSYIVLEDIVELVKTGTDFVIEDTKTGEDITRSILSQVIFERESAQSNFHFPLEVQKQLISMYDDTYGQMMPEYLKESMKVFVNERERMKGTFQEIIEQNSKAMAEFSENLARQNMDAFNRTFEFFKTMSGFPAQENSTAKDEEKPSHSSESGGELDEIQAQINALQDRLKNLKQGK